MGLDVSRVERVTSGQCSLCSDCTDACPVEGALHTSWSGKAKIAGTGTRVRGAAPTQVRRPLPLFGSPLRPLMAVLLFGAVIGISIVGGLWQTRAEAGSGASAQSGDSAGAGVVPESDHEGEALPLDGSALPEEVKGRMTLKEVADAFHADPADVLAALGAPPDTDTSLSVKAIAGTYGGSVDDLRVWLGTRSAPAKP